MLLVRAAAAADLDAVVRVSHHLDSVNLPSDRQRLGEVIDRSERSFAGTLDTPGREFMFVLADADAPGEPIIGVSMIFARHGSRKAPHSFFDVLAEERYSDTLDRHFRHTVLRIGMSYEGMTEVGGLVVLPEHRRRPEQAGKILAYVRFLYMALHRDGFCATVVSELMPPLEPDGTSLLWEALGRHFTGLSYQEADRLSRENKEFIRSLFPQDPIYVALLPPSAQAQIGMVGPGSRAVENLLGRVGFAYANRIDPFDGGPHFHARTDDITLVRTARRVKLQAVTGEASLPVGPGEAAADALVAAEATGTGFRATRSLVRLAGGQVVLPAGAARVLGVAPGAALAVVPLPLPLPLPPSTPRSSAPPSGETARRPFA